MKKYIALVIVVLMVCAVGAAVAAQNVEVKFLNNTQWFLDFYVDDTFKCCIGPGAYFTVYVTEGMHTFKSCERGRSVGCTVHTGYINASDGPYTWTISPK